MNKQSSNSAGRLATGMATTLLLVSPSLAGAVGSDSTDARRLEVGTVSPRVGRTDARVRYTIVGDATVRVTILDARGRTVLVLADGAQKAGTHELRWNGLGPSGQPAASGLYIAHVEAGGASGSRHLILVQ